MLGGDTGKIILGIVMLVVVFLMFPLVLTGIQSILGWTSGGATLADFSGMPTLVAITPLLIWVGMLGAGGWMTFSGFKGKREGGKGGKGKKH